MNIGRYEKKSKIEVKGSWKRRRDGSLEDRIHSKSADNDLNYQVGLNWRVLGKGHDGDLITALS